MGFFGIIDRLGGFDLSDEDLVTGVERRRELLTHRFLVLVTFMVLTYNIIYLSLGYLELWMVNSFVVVSCVVATVLQRKGRSTTAKSVMVLSCAAGLVGLGVYFGSDSQLPIGCIFAALLCPLMFGSQERAAMVSCFLFSTACLVGFSTATWLWTWPSTTTPAFRKGVELSFLAGTAVVIFGTLAQLTVMYESLNHQLTRKSRKLAAKQRDLRDSKERKEALLAALPDACFLVSHDPQERKVRLKDVRGRAHTIWRKLAPGFDLNVFLSEKSLRAVSDALEMARERTDAHSFSFQWRRWNKSFHAEARVAWLRENEFIAIIRDVTAQHHARMALRAQELKLIHAAKMATLGEMAGNIAHEINNPLTVIVGLTDMAGARIAESGGDTSGVSALLTRISTTAKRIARITVGLRQMARDGRSDPIEPVRLAEVIDETLALCEHSLKTRGITFRVEPDVLECVVLSRTVQLGQVLLNLIGNASDALEGKEVREITLSAERTNGRVILRIIDSGARIPDAVVEKLFVPFFTTKGVGKGTGLGLSISRNIIDSQGGRLYLDMQRSQTCFCIELADALNLGETGLLPQSA